MNRPADIVLHLPIPPSTNALWSTAPGKKRVRSPEYSTWLRVAGWDARRQLVGVPTITGCFNASIVVPEKSRRDRDNWSKALLDLCQQVRAIRNDSGLRDYTVTADGRSDCRVALWTCDGPEQREPKPLRLSSRPYRARATPQQVARARAAGALV